MELVVKRRHKRCEFDNLGQEDPLEKEMTTHSSLFAWRLPWTEEPGGLQCPWGRKRIGHDNNNLS